MTFRRPRAWPRVGDALRFSGLHARYTDAFNEFVTLPEKVGSSTMCIVMGIAYCNYYLMADATAADPCGSGIGAG